MKYVDGNITEATQFFIAHGCNAQGAMGSGVAQALRVKWPQIFEPYKRACNSMHILSDSYAVSFVPVDVPDHVVLNLITQDRYGRDGKKYASYLRITESLTDVIDLYSRALNPVEYDRNQFEIAIPKIGAGLGGLKWEFVEEILKELEEKYPNVEFVVYVPDLHAF